MSGLTKLDLFENGLVGGAGIREFPKFLPKNLVEFSFGRAVVKESGMGALKRLKKLKTFNCYYCFISRLGPIAKMRRWVARFARPLGAPWSAVA